MKLYNSLTKKKEVFKEIHEGEVNIYGCGVSTYNHMHLGHGRCYVTWDVLKRWLIHKEYKVNYIQNFTDIDDKIINKANEEGVDWKTISDRYINSFFNDIEVLNILPATSYPRATQYINDIHSFIKGLIDKGKTYSLDGSVLFKLDKNNEYPGLSKKKINDDDEINEDFTLWKSKEDEPIWESPWGKGRPGWHIECSSMIYKCFKGKTIDIHVGGVDLKFPHHHNELLQSQSLTNIPLSNYWLHNGMVLVDGKKMSKSLNNFIFIRDLFPSLYHPNVFRLMVLQSSYRSPLDFSTSLLKQSNLLWANIKKALSYSPQNNISPFLDLSIINSFNNAMDNDLNTSLVISNLSSLVKKVNTSINCISHNQISPLSISNIYSYIYTIKHILSILGFSDLSNKPFDDVMKLDGKDKEYIKRLIEERNQLRRNKEYLKADVIRNKLLDMNINLIDLSDRTIYKFNK